MMNSFKLGKDQDWYAFCTVLLAFCVKGQELEGTGGRKAQEKAVAVFCRDPEEKWWRPRLKLWMGG